MGNLQSGSLVAQRGSKITPLASDWATRAATSLAHPCLGARGARGGYSAQPSCAEPESGREKHSGGPVGGREGGSRKR
eukprot:13608293-Alexandrium_andersonii.AAC.1